MGSTWNGYAFFAGVRTQVAGNVERAANDLKTAYKQLIGIQGPPRSRPGEPPHRDTGNLQGSIQVIGPAEQGDLVFCSVGTDVPYGLYLEMGTSRVAARPWIVSGLRNNQAKIINTIARGNQMSMEQFQRSVDLGPDIELVTK